MSRMACPRCGGEDRRVIAPGYFECASLIPVTQGLTPAGVPVPGSAACGHRYQGGTPVNAAGVCACQTNAIGTCAECARPVCGDHSELAEDKRICVTCLQARATQEMDAVASSHAEVIAGLQAVANPVERLLRTAWYVVNATYNSHVQRRTGASGNDLYTVFPEFAGAPSGKIRRDGQYWKVPKDHWDSAEIGRWFVSAAARRGIGPPHEISVVTIKEPRFRAPFITAEQTLRCWSIMHGAGYILTDGRVVVGEEGHARYLGLMSQLSLSQFTELHPIDLGLDALAWMADALGLKTSQPGRLSAMAAWK